MQLKRQQYFDENLIIAASWKKLCERSVITSEWRYLSECNRSADISQPLNCNTEDGSFSNAYRQQKP